MNATEVNINHDDWTLFTAQGNVDLRGVSVDRVDDDTVRINRTQHRREDLSIHSDGRMIQSKIAGWYLSR